MKSFLFLVVMAFSLASYSVPIFPSNEGPATEIVKSDNLIFAFTIDLEIAEHPVCYLCLSRDIAFEGIALDGVYPSFSLGRTVPDEVDQFTAYLGLNRSTYPEKPLEEPLEPPLCDRYKNVDNTRATTQSLSFSDIPIDPGWHA